LGRLCNNSATLTILQQERAVHGGDRDARADTVIRLYKEGKRLLLADE
jgi:hypothetical protein